MYQIVDLDGKKSIRESEKLPEIPKKGMVWVNVIAKEYAELEELEKKFGFHRLILEDALSPTQRAKVEIFEEYFVVITKTLGRKQSNGNPSAEQFTLLVGKNFLVTISRKRFDFVDEVREKSNIMKLKISHPDFLAYMLLDKIVDGYFPILEEIEDEIELVEKKILSKAGEKTLKDIFRLKKRLLIFRKSVWPARDVFATLSRGGLPNMKKSDQIFYRDIYDHMIVIMDLTETYHDLISSALETYLSSVSNRMNEVMKVLTVVATIFIPLTFITGLYGMNFQWIPEMHSGFGQQYGYFLALGMMLAVSLAMIAYFKKKKWL